MTELKLLAAGARSLISPAFLTGEAGVDISEYLRAFPRQLDLEPLRFILEKAIERFDDDHPERSDAWLAPRVHATLRLTRREAAQRDLWAYLAVVEFPEYVRWRWGAVLDRFLGNDTNHALSRLWWGAELVRNGSDYGLVETAFEVQDIPNTWFRLRAFHNRPAAIAAVRVLGTIRGGAMNNDRQVKRTKRINLLSTAFNTLLTTVALDGLCPYRGEDAGAIKEWIEGEADETLMLDRVPLGPPEEPASEDQITTVEKLLIRVGEAAGLLNVAEIDEDE